MKNTILATLVLFSFSPARAADFSFQCHQVRTTAEEAAATTPLKAVDLFVSCDEFRLGTAEFEISVIDERLLYGGVPMTHVSYGGYFTSTLEETFLCKRPI